MKKKVVRVFSALLAIVCLLTMFNLSSFAAGSISAPTIKIAATTTPLTSATNYSDIYKYAIFEKYK